jgi:hypothetical protein
MAHDLSDIAGFRVDNASGTLTDISGDVTQVTVNGGNGLIEDTGLGDANRTEQRDIGAVKAISITGMMNTTTRAIYAPLAAKGTSVTKTIEVELAASGAARYITGEANVGPVSISIPVGLQTFTAEYRSTSGTGFDSTSVAAS